MEEIKSYQIECSIERKYLKIQQNILEIKSTIVDTLKIDAILNYLIKAISKS